MQILEYIFRHYYYYKIKIMKTLFFEKTLQVHRRCINQLYRDFKYPQILSLNAAVIRTLLKIFLRIS